MCVDVDRVEGDMVGNEVWSVKVVVVVANSSLQLIECGERELMWLDMLNRSRCVIRQVVFRLAINSACNGGVSRPLSHLRGFFCIGEQSSSRAGERANTDILVLCEAE